MYSLPVMISKQKFHININDNWRVHRYFYSTCKYLCTSVKTL